MSLSLGAGIALGSFFVSSAGVGILVIKSRGSKRNCKYVSEPICLARTKVLEVKIDATKEHLNDKMETVIQMLKKNGFREK